MKRSTKLMSVIVPTYNESQNIVPLVRQILDLNAGPVEVVVVDDASPDGTADLVRQRFGHEPAVKLIVRDSDRGLAKSIRRGIEESTGDVLLVMDSDFNHDPAIIKTMRAFLEHYDLVVGSRFVAGGGMEDTFRYYCSASYNVLIRTLLGTRLQDNLSGFFAIRKACLARMNFDAIFFGYGDYFFRLLNEAADLELPVVEVPVYYRRRTGGESKTHFLKVLGLYTTELVHLVSRTRLKRRPIKAHDREP